MASPTREGATGRTLAWLDRHRDDDLVISDWVTTEISSALALKQRTGQLRAQDRLKALAAFAALRADALRVLPVTASHFIQAARLIDRDAKRLRAADAMHLAICLDQGASLCTADRTLAAAGRAAGLTTLSP